MKSIKKQLEDLAKQAEHLTFPEIFLKARQNFGIAVYKISANTGIPISRLRRIEAGFFKTALDKEELKNLCDFYDLPLEKMEKKMDQYLEKFFFETKASRYFSNGK